VVDAADPAGRFIGSIVVRGGSATRLAPVLAGELEGLKPHEDAPEFHVPIKMCGVKRKNTTVAARRVLNRKSLEPTREAISVLHAVVSSPFRVTQALEQLDETSASRDVKSVEIRDALQHIRADDIFSNLPRSVGDIGMALLRATEPISQSDLTKQADLSGTTVRNHADGLIETGLVQRDEKSSGTKEWRMTLSFSNEREHDIYGTIYSQSLQEIVNGHVECDCSGESLAALHNGISGGLNESCLLSEWEQVRAKLSDIADPCEGTTYEIQLGNVRQTAIEDVVDTGGSGESLSSTDNDTDDNSSSDNQDDFGFSNVSIEGARDDL